MPLLPWKKRTDPLILYFACFSFKDQDAAFTHLPQNNCTLMEKKSLRAFCLMLIGKFFSFNLSLFIITLLKTHFFRCLYLQILTAFCRDPLNYHLTKRQVFLQFNLPHTLQSTSYSDISFLDPLSTLLCSSLHLLVLRWVELNLEWIWHRVSAL